MRLELLLRARTKINKHNFVTAHMFFFHHVWCVINPIEPFIQANHTHNEVGDYFLILFDYIDCSDSSNRSNVIIYIRIVGKYN